MKTHLKLRRKRTVRQRPLLANAKRLARLGGLVALLPVLAGAQNIKENLAPLRLEHVRLNVADAAATARWYAEYADLEILPGAPAGLVYVADKDHNFMIEFSAIPELKTNYADVPVDGFHLAFEGHKTIEAVAERLLAHGARPEGEIYRNKIGDYVLNVRDPNGVTIQLLHRVNPFFSKPVKSNLRFEHFAFNTPDQKRTALWYVEFLGLAIPWSKDIEVTNSYFRNYRVPYVGDHGRNMSLELFGKPDVEMTFAKVNHEVCHLAFTTDAPEKWAKQMVYGGARQVGPARTEANGDVVVDLFDPSNFPVRLIQRNKAVLKP
jgi:catechol 2,3-dioxygenase-like lactoylglutathione lyase family enzyme